MKILKKIYFKLKYFITKFFMYFHTKKKKDLNLLKLNNKDNKKDFKLNSKKIKITELVWHVEYTCPFNDENIRYIISIINSRLEIKNLKVIDYKIKDYEEQIIDFILNNGEILRVCFDPYNRYN